MADEIPIKVLYTEADLEGLATLGTLPGLAPFLRGAKATMYANRPWTVRQYAGFATPEETNAYYRDCLAAGQTGLSVAFDLATHRGYDSDDPRVVGDVGKAGVAIDTVEDMRVLFQGIPLDRVSVSMTMSGAVLPVLASFIVAGLEQGLRLDQLAGTIQNDILKEFIVRNTYIYPPEPSMRVVADIIAYTGQRMPKFNCVSISGYHMAEAGATPVQELGFTLANGLEYVRTALASGLSIDEVTPRLSFFFSVGMDLFVEIAKLRAARLVWAELMGAFAPKRPESLVLRMHTQTSGVSLAADLPHNNIVRTTIEALAAVLGGTQSLHTNSFDEALGLPTTEAATLARNTQLIIAEETGITRVIDPLGGSYYVEHLTASMAEAARAVIREIEAVGGMARAVSGGMPQRRIEAAAIRNQARIDRGEKVVVGVNKFRSPDDRHIEIRDIDNAAVRQKQVQRIEGVRAKRDGDAVRVALAALTEAAQSGSGNLLALAVDAMRARATVGEATQALEVVFTRYQAPVDAESGNYATAYHGDPEFDRVHAAVDRFADDFGFRPRIAIVKLGQDGHDRGAKIITTAFADLGFELVPTPLFQTPEEAAALVIQASAHIVGVSSQAGAHMTLVPALISELRRLGGDDIVVICGGIIPARDHPTLTEAGISAIYGPGTNVLAAAQDVLRLLVARRKLPTWPSNA
jgi:methylmalonyl-CoA mutase